jgi:hydrogenase expression/formation protein HypD
MRFVEEYRDAVRRGRWRAIRRVVTKPWTLMEVCGARRAIVRFGIDQLLPRASPWSTAPAAPSA